MRETTNTTSITAAVEAAAFPTPTARKTGRDPRWPYVPVLILPGQPDERVVTQQIRGKAFATRDEAVAHAAAVVEAMRLQLAKDLAKPGYRAMRQQYGLPREIAEVTA